MFKVAVITGGHHFDVPAFHQLFRALTGIDAYVQHLADFIASPPEVRQAYAAIVCYAHLQGEPVELGLAPGRQATARSVLAELGDGRGVVVLHHGLLAFQGWAVWDAIVGLPDRTLAGYAHGEAIACRVADAAHPICAGLADWTLTDETYQLPDAAGDNHVLLTTDHPRSMKTLSWTRTYQQSRVFCLASGDGKSAWNDANFRTLLRQGILWSARGEGDN